MDHISFFLERYREKYQDIENESKLEIEKIINLIKNETAVTLLPSQIEIRNNTVKIKVSGAMKSVLLEKREQIREKINLRLF